MPTKPKPQTPPQAPSERPQSPSDLPRLPIHPGTYNVSDLKSITGDQLWFAALLIELRFLNEKLDAILERLGDTK